MNNRNNAVLGLIFVGLGIIFLIGNFFGRSFDIFNVGFFFSHFWPLFIILPGLIFHMAFFSGNNRDAGLLVPGGILLTIGAVCQISMLFHMWSVMWPGFILSVAIGLFELYIFGNRDKGLLIPVGILGGLSLFAFFFTLPSIFSPAFRPFLLPLILIAIGAAIFLKNSKRDEF